MSQGIFIVLEGADGSGKTTQFEALQKRLRGAGYEIAVFDFPRYDHTSSYFVKRYLNGEYGPAASINPYTASLFFAMDRFETAPDIRDALAAGKIVLSNRYVGSNMAHQGSKFTEPIEKRSFFVWEDSLEFQLLNIPRPDMSLFLRVPAEVSYNLIGQKSPRSYTGHSHDEHEKDIDHLRRSVETYDLLCQLFPKDFKPIECAPNGTILNVDSISNLVWQVVEPLLPPLKRQPRKVNNNPEPKPASEQTVQTEGNWTISKISLLAANELRLFEADVRLAPTWRSGSTSFNFYTPDGISEELKSSYGRVLNKLAKLHKAAYSRLTAKGLSDAQVNTLLRNAVPLAATTRAVVNLEQKSALRLLMKVKASPNLEVNALAGQLEALIRQFWPKLWKEHKNEVNEQNPKSVGSIIEKLSLNSLPQKLAAATEGVKVIEITPRNEFDLLADYLYPSSNLSRPEIASQIELWSYQQKQAALTLAISRPESEALRLARYRLDLLSNWLELSNIMRLELAHDIQLQPPTPRFGYEVAELLAETGVEDIYLEMFDTSLEIYSAIQSEVDGYLPGYAALQGHKLRWQASFSAYEIGRLDPQAALTKAIFDKIKENHPLIGEHLAAIPETNRSRPPLKKTTRQSQKRSKK